VLILFGTTLFLFVVPMVRKRRDKELGKSMATAIECRVPFLFGFHDNVAELAVKIGKELGLKGSQLQLLERSAYVQNLGLCSIPAEIVLKTEEWTPTEEATFDRHPELGAAILQKIPNLSDCASIVQFQNSRFESSFEAPLESRILIVAGEYVRLQIHHSSSRAIRAIEQQSGLLFDPIVVDALKAVAKEQTKSEKISVI
jgi:response regulator RpfG family c-di-GMP phosphodiesterase